MTYTLMEIVEQLRACEFKCEAGLLENNTAFVALEEMAEREKSMLFEHRNGETEPPTIQGQYWFNGSRFRQPLGVEHVHVGIIHIWLRKGEMCMATPLLPIGPVARIRGRWWGPLTAPWEAT